MEKLIILGDTHCYFDVMEEIIKYEQAQSHHIKAVLHAGDLGIYDDNSVNILSERELYLIKKHNNPVGQFQEYLDKTKTFEVSFEVKDLLSGTHEIFRNYMKSKTTQPNVPSGKQLLYEFGLDMENDKALIGKMGKLVQHLKRMEKDGLINSREAALKIARKWLESN